MKLESASCQIIYWQGGRLRIANYLTRRTFATNPTTLDVIRFFFTPRTIRNALFWIPRINRLRKAGGWYIPADDLQEALDDVYEHAMDNAAAEALGGEHTAASLGTLVDRERLLAQAYEMIVATHNERPSNALGMDALGRDTLI